MKYFKFFLILLFLFNNLPLKAQYITTEYKNELLTEARKFEENFYENLSLEEKYSLLIKAKAYMDSASCNSVDKPEKEIIEAYSYVKCLENLETFLVPGDSFEQYKYITVALRLYTEYYEIAPEEKLAEHIAKLHRVQKKNELKPYIHYGFYKNDIFNFSIATPAFDYFENLSLSCFQIEVSNNSTNEVDFGRFKFYIQMIDGTIIHEEIDFEKNKEFYESLPPMPDGYIFGKVGILGSDRALKLFPIIEDEAQIEKVVMQDKTSDFKIEALFFENY